MGRALQRYKRLFDQVKKNAAHRVYFLYGPEEFLKKEFVSELIKSRLPGQNRAFNLDIFYGDDFDRDLFLDRISTFPLFSDQRLIVLKNFDGLPAGNQDFVLESIEKLSESVILVVEAQSSRPDTARMKKLEQIAERLGLAFSFQHLSDDETIERARTRLEREGHRISPEALELLVESVGTHLVDLANEIEKIAVSTDAGAEIGREDVAAVVGRYRTENLFGLLAQIGRGEPARVIAMMHRVIDGGEDPVFVLAMVLRRILQLLHVRFVLDESRSQPATVRDRLTGSLSPFQIGILLEQSKLLSSTDLQIYLGNLRWADYKIKSTAVDPRHLLETALVASDARKTLALPWDRV
jgi:DNA polymerase-3 subunit delta